MFIPPLVIDPLSIKSLNVNNGAETISSDGFRSIRYRDEYVGGSWSTPAGAAAPDTVSVTLGGIGMSMLAFDGGNTEEKKSNHFEISHDIAIDALNAEAARVEFHCHFMPSTTGAGIIKWFFDYSYSPVLAAPVEQTTLDFSQAVDTQQYVHFVKGVELPKPASGFTIGDVINFTIRRKPADAGDTYEADVYLLKCALHIPIDCSGSRQRYTR